MAYLKNVATVGLGYLVYKGLMTELAKTPDNGGVTVKAGQLIGWDKPSEFKDGIKLWSERVGIAGPVAELSEQRWGEGFEGPPTPLKEITFGIGGSLLPEGFELEGVTKELGRPGLRPKGL